LEEDEESREAEWTSGCEAQEDDGFERVELGGAGMRAARRRSTKKRPSAIKASGCCSGCCPNKGATIVTLPTRVQNSKVEAEPILQ
jgi:hypothetical protein